MMNHGTNNTLHHTTHYTRHTQACSTGHVGANAACLAVAYAILGALMLQSLSHLESLARWQQQEQHRLGCLRARQRARARRALSHDGHTPPGCQGAEGAEDEWVDFWPPEEAEAEAEEEGMYPYPYPYPCYAPPAPPFPLPFADKGSRQQQQQGGRSARRQQRQRRQRQQQQQQQGQWTPARGGSNATASCGSSSLLSAESPDRGALFYGGRQLHPQQAEGEEERGGERWVKGELCVCVCVCVCVSIDRSIDRSVARSTPGRQPDNPSTHPRTEEEEAAGRTSTTPRASPPPRWPRL